MGGHRRTAYRVPLQDPYRCNVVFGRL